MLRERSFQIALVLWVPASLVVFPLSGGKLPSLRTANAWVHLWGYHAITPHVTADTPMIVKIFGIH